MVGVRRSDITTRSSVTVYLRALKGFPRKIIVPNILQHVIGDRNVESTRVCGAGETFRCVPARESKVRALAHS